jgi:outer membrane protein OmpA-like peptidoglycan-associated protein
MKRLPLVTALATLLVSPLLAATQATKPGVATPTSLARLNVTGTWDGNFLGGSGFQLSQEGDRVWGKFTYGNGQGFARGSWSEGRLILILTPTDGKVGGSCDPRKIITIPAKGTATRIEPFVLDLDRNVSYQGAMTRSSPSPGPAVEYPYEAELKNCGQLFTYDLAFGTNSDKLAGADWRILEVLAGLLKSDPALKIQITGHTDSTGDATANQDLSARRAETVKKTLTERYGADANRITWKGYGAEQPLAENDTERGRALNRRVEIVLVP